MNGSARTGMASIAPRLDTLRSLDASVSELLDRAGAAGFDGGEFAYRVRESPFGDALAPLDRNDLDAVVVSARRGDGEWLVYGHDDPADPVGSIGRGAGTLRAALR